MSTCRRVDLSVCRPVGVSTYRCVDLLVCRLSACRPVGVSNCRCVDLSACRPVGTRPVSLLINNFVWMVKLLEQYHRFTHRGIVRSKNYLENCLDILLRPNNFE